jgi:proline iminopeptidase
VRSSLPVPPTEHRAGRRPSIRALPQGRYPWRREVEWLTHDVGRIFPREWERFAAVPETLRRLPLVDAYATLLFDRDPAVRDRAAREWCAWEDAHVSLTPGHRPNPRYDDPEFRLRFARLVTHYWRHAAFLEEEQLLRDAPRLNGIPGVLIHGRYDVSTPLETAWRLSRRWSTSRLQVLDDTGHGGGDSLVSAIVGALDEFAAI